MLEEIAALVKNQYATSVDSDLAFSRKLTKHAQRFWRQHRMLYCKRVFAAPQEPAADVSWKMPQWIGTADTNTPEQYPMRGFYLPNDEEGMLYYGNRRFEEQNPEAYRELPQFKASAPGSAMSPTRLPARSKAGAAILNRSPSPSQDSMWSSWSEVAARMSTQP
jgi:hypothetical protein